MQGGSPTGQISGQPSLPLPLLPPAAPSGCSLPALSGRLSSTPRSPSPAATAAARAAAGIPSNGCPRFANVLAWPLLTATVGNSHRATATLQCFPARARGVSSPSNAAALQPKLQQCSQAGDTLCTGPRAVSVIQTPTPLKIFEGKASEKAEYRSARGGLSEIRDASPLHY